MVDFNKINKPYLIGEIGINHNGDMQVAKKLIDAVFACNWDCAKFQKRNPDVCVPEHQKNKMRQTPWGEMTYIDYKHKVEFNHDDYNYIDSYCREKPVDWTASVWDFDSLEFLMNYNLPFLKIPSAMITDKELVQESAKSGFPICISSGMSSLQEVDDAVNNVLKHTDNFVLMHTNSSYPTPPEELNLSLIPFYKERYGCAVGYSGHEQKLEPTVIAATLGAKVIERHITLSHDMWGTDQKSSVEVVGMDILHKRIKDIQLVLGKPEKKVTNSEIAICKKLRGDNK
tara:strand:+ start:896 stop:1753 length:858 start_codon:yes stop_codon:yes gene_type:complete